MNDLRERLAALEHDQWACIVGDMLDKLAPVLPTEYLSGVPSPGEQAALDAVEYWKRLRVTAYDDLTEAEKDRARKRSDKVLALATVPEEYSQAANDLFGRLHVFFSLWHKDYLALLEHHPAPVGLAWADGLIAVAGQLGATSRIVTEQSGHGR